MGERGDRPQALPERSPIPAIEKWDCDIEEEEADAAAVAADQEEEEEENWDTASDELSWENLVTPPTDYTGIPTRVDMEKYYLVHGPDLDLTPKETERETNIKM